MARIGKPSNRPSKVPVLIAVAAAGAVGTTVVLQQLPTEPAPVLTAAIAEQDFGDGFEGDAGAGAPPPAACPPPVPLTRVEKTWAQLWAYGYPCGRMQICERRLKQYPDGQSYPAPAGAEKGTYTVVPFVAQAGSVNWYMDQIQNIPAIRYNERPADAMLVTVSRCDGDVAGAAMPASCSLWGNSGSLIWTSNGNPAACPVVPGETYYLHIAAVDPRDGITTTETTCADVPASANGCDVGVRISSGL